MKEPEKDKKVIRNGDWCRFCNSYSNASFDICEECFKKKLDKVRKAEREKIVKQIFDDIERYGTETHNFKDFTDCVLLSDIKKVKSKYLKECDNL